jgi:hypothetical protein
MIVNSFNCEFGYELISVIPFAYWLHKNNQLTGTISAKGTEPFYYFSPKHTINTNPRNGWGNQYITTPNKQIHVKQLDLNWFKCPPYPLKYANNKYKWDKPTLIIYNKYQKEWKQPPINFIDLATLVKLFDLLSPKYQIIYINFDKATDLQDDNLPLKFNDHQLVKMYPDIIDIYDLPADNFNLLQLQIMSNCKNYITINGGFSILASYFGGINLIYSKYCREIKSHQFRWYRLFGGSQIHHCPGLQNLVDMTVKCFL